jgi:dephospho-CoA kinase
VRQTLFLDSMLRIGLTGNIASGKSTVARALAQHGATVVDADQLAREAVAPGQPALAAIARRFGSEVLLPDGTLDRGALRNLVFADDEARAALNAIVHPEVARLRTERAAVAAAAGVTVFVDEIPLLFEVGLAAEFDAIVFVDAPEAERLRRLVRDRGLPEPVARAMMASQGEAAPKRAQATWIIDNAGTRAELLERVASVWQDMQDLQDQQAMAAPSGP